MAKYIVTFQCCKGTNFKIIEEVEVRECTNCKNEIDLFGLSFYMSEIKEESE